MEGGGGRHQNGVKTTFQIYTRQTPDGDYNGLLKEEALHISQNYYFKVNNVPRSLNKDMLRFLTKAFKKKKKKNWV